MVEPNKPETVLPQALVTQLVARLHTIADALKPTDALQLIVDSKAALQHPELMQYVCGTEHLDLAITYLERAIGVNTTEKDTSLSVPNVPEAREAERKTYVACVWNKGELGDETKVPLERQVFQANSLATAQLTAQRLAATYSGEVEWEAYADADEAVPDECDDDNGMLDYRYQHRQTGAVTPSDE